MPNDQPVIVLENVTKTYGNHVAFNQLSLSVPRGVVDGFIGPNGSGKTSTLRMIMRILHPDSGRIQVLGDESNDSSTERIGYLPEERGLYKDMKVGEMLAFYARLKGMRQPKEAVDRWLQAMGLTEWKNKKVQALSKGMAQKVQFISSVVAAPELVILDEPFSGLDPVNQEVLRDAVLDLRKLGTTVVFSTHDMAVSEKMCDSIFMIYRGNKVLDGDLESIQDAYGSDTVRVRMDCELPDELPGVQKTTDFGRYQELRLQPQADTRRLLSALMDAGNIQLFEVTRPSLHDIFVRIARPTAEETVHA